uniref:Uncharacterized protein n=1 Tax=Candidatus Kentrum sp. LFY TaxID=2126342 RepID=A0A450WSG9_9GAMM|nr:MAG: hypothetical protein BECKLFY1418C_GA0070996_106518 [Candidatus Kentron sp. LFY]
MPVDIFFENGYYHGIVGLFLDRTEIEQKMVEVYLRDGSVFQFCFLLSWLMRGFPPHIGIQITFLNNRGFILRQTILGKDVIHITIECRKS